MTIHDQLLTSREDKILAFRNKEECYYKANSNEPLEQPKPVAVNAKERAIQLGHMINTATDITFNIYYQLHLVSVDLS